MNRRGFLCASAAPLVGRAAPSNRITVGMIGVGRQAVQVNLKQFLAMADVQVVAVCDVDAWRLENARAAVDKAYGNKGCAAYRDYREMLARKDVDAVMISTPDHWHVPMCLEAVQAGKDVSCEKPLTRTIAEGRRLSDAVRRAKRVFRTDSEFRSLEPMHRAVELVRNGMLGKIHTIRTGVPAGDKGCPPQPEMPVPPELDYERWQGPAPRAPYTENRVHPPKGYGRPGWMRHLYYCDGMVTNWGTHLNDIAQWGNNTERSGPVEVSASGQYPPRDSFWNVLLGFEAEYRYASGVRLIYKIDRPYVRFEGSEGWIQVDYPKPLTAQPASLLTAKLPAGAVRFPLQSDKRDFIDAVKSRGQTLEDAEVGHRTTSLCHLAHIAIHTGKRLVWDPVRERFPKDPAVNRYITEPIRAPRPA